MLGAFRPNDDMFAFGQAGRLEIIGDLVTKVHVDDMLSSLEMHYKLFVFCTSFRPALSLPAQYPLPSSVSAAALALL